MDGRRFDDFARGLATATAATTSRRRVLGSVLGGLVAALAGGFARTSDANAATVPCARVCSYLFAPGLDRQQCQRLAARRRNFCVVGCVQFCADTFPPGAERRQCVRDAARGRGLCHDCGPASDGTRELCGTTCCCTSDDQCNDGNGCTLNICGPTSRLCHAVPLGTGALTCTQCADDGDCAGGICCHGRCCPAGGRCEQGVNGIGICCLAGCGGDCCDEIRLDRSVPDSVEYQILRANCTFPAYGFCCTGFDGSYIDENGEFQPRCTRPRGRVS